MPYLSITKAREMLKDSTPPITATVNLPLDQAVGRTLAEPIIAARPSPPFDRAAMDGYATQSQSVPGRLRILGSAAAGSTWPGVIQPGTTVRVLTGAPLPAGSDTVIEQEQVTVEEGHAVIHRPFAAWRNISRTGSEYQAGDCLLSPGERINAVHLGQIASSGTDHVPVFRSPRVLLITTGSELTALGQPLDEGHIFDVNRTLFASLLKSASAEVTLGPVLEDSPEALEEVFSRDLSPFDFVLTTGGVSVGDKDYVIQYLSQKTSLLFWRVDMHPGKSIAAARHHGTTIVALSGNPGAALTSWYLLVLPLLAHLNQGIWTTKEVPGTLLRAFPKKTRETRYLRVRFVPRMTGTEFDSDLPQSSDGIQSYTAADGLVVIPHGSEPLAEKSPVTGLLVPGIGASKTTWHGR